MSAGSQPNRVLMTASGQGAAAEERRELAIDREIISLRSGQLDVLLETLARARGSDAAAVREEIGALRLIRGTIRLLPTEGELTALRTALAELAVNPSEAPQPDKRSPSRRETLT